MIMIFSMGKFARFAFLWLAVAGILLSERQKPAKVANNGNSMVPAYVGYHRLCASHRNPRTSFFVDTNHNRGLRLSRDEELLFFSHNFFLLFKKSIVAKSIL